MDEKKLPHRHHEGTESMFDHMPKPEESIATAEIFSIMGDSTRLRLFWLL